MREFGIPNLVRFPIVPDLSAAGDSGKPLVVEDPFGATAQAFSQLGAAVVREVSQPDCFTAPGLGLRVWVVWEVSWVE